MRPRRGFVRERYNFDLRTNELTTALVPNPTAGTEHAFSVYRLAGDPVGPLLVLRERLDRSPRPQKSVATENDSRLH